MVAAGDEVADVFGDIDKPKGGNAIMQHALFPLAGKVTALSVSFLYCLRSNKKIIQKREAIGYSKITKGSTFCRKTIRYPICTSKNYRK